MRLFARITILVFSLTFLEASITAPPPSLPVKIRTSFTLLNLNSIDEKHQSFNADVTFTFIWKDERLAFTAQDGQNFQIFLEDAAIQQLEKIWRPQLEWLNASSLNYNNRTLMINKDGVVRYDIGLNGDFITALNFENFPFDKQTLEIKLDSFLWSENVLVFVPTQHGEIPLDIETNLHTDLKILNARAIVETETSTGLSLFEFESSDNYSTYTVQIHIARDPSFFIFQLLVPLFIIVGICCSVFFAYDAELLNKVTMNLTGFLVFLAAKFTLNQDLPRVGYMTVIDKTFLSAYFIISLSVIVCVVCQLFKTEEKNWAYKVNWNSRWAIPLIFFLLIAWNIYPN